MEFSLLLVFSCHRKSSASQLQHQCPPGLLDFELFLCNIGPQIHLLFSKKFQKKNQFFFKFKKKKPVSEEKSIVKKIVKKNGQKKGE